MLIVNDDGIDADGIKELEKFARGFFRDVVVVAPYAEQSGMGHAISYRKTLAVHKIDDTHFAVEGTPADCAIVGIHHVMKDNPPDLVLSGINHGDNAGNAVMYSGTFGGAFEAALCGVRAISFSQLRQSDKTMDFGVSQKYLPQVFDYLARVEWPDHVVMNVNFPSFDNHRRETPHFVESKRQSLFSGLDVATANDRKAHVTIRLEQRFEDKGDGHDLDILAQGGVTITPVRTNWTCYDTLKTWAG